MAQVKLVLSGGGRRRHAGASGADDSDVDLPTADRFPGGRSEVERTRLCSETISRDPSGQKKALHRGAATPDRTTPSLRSHRRTNSPAMRRGPALGPLSTSPPGQEQKRCCLCTAHVNACASDSQMISSCTTTSAPTAAAGPSSRSGTAPVAGTATRAGTAPSQCSCCVGVGYRGIDACPSCAGRGVVDALNTLGRTSARRPGPAEGRRRAARPPHPGRPDERRARRPPRGHRPGDPPRAPPESLRRGLAVALRVGGPRGAFVAAPWFAGLSAAAVIGFTALVVLPLGVPPVRRLVWVRVRAVVLQHRLRTAWSGPASTPTPGASRRSCGLRRGARPTA